MTSYQNFQNDNAKHTKASSRLDTNNPSFNPTVSATGTNEQDSFHKNLHKYVDLVSFYRWYPDLWYDLITPETGGIRLDLDQRLFLRCLARFLSTYGVFPRGYGKTYKEILAMIHGCVFHPEIEISMSAQTQEAAAKIMQEKFNEIMRHYPLLINEIDGKPSFTTDSAEIKFRSGGKIDILANHQASKGRRRKRLQIEESALINDTLFQDVLEPIVNVPRRTIGKEAVINPEELNGQINFFTTAWFRGSTEFERSLRMIDEMAELKGKIVLGSSWELACSYGRGEAKAQILHKKATLSPIFFATNYESKWCGAVDGALVSINKVIDLRTLVKPELKNDDKEAEIVISMDVARSQNDSNNQSSIAVLKIKRNKNNKVKQIDLVNLINLQNGLNFFAQTVELKRIKKLYNAKFVVVDGNGLGSAIIDEALKDTIDPLTGESLGCWDTINTDHQPDTEDAEQIIFNLQAQGINSDIIVNFIDMVESKKLQLLIKKQDSNYDINDTDYIKSNVLPYIQTDLFIEEVANLKLKKLPSGKYSVEQVTRKVNKDRFSAVSYGCWYIKTFLDNNDGTNDEDLMFFMSAGF